jgi:hypothetical protein
LLRERHIEKRTGSLSGDGCGFAQWLGESLVHGKGQRRAVMPLRRDVWTAVVAYLRQGHPAKTSRHLFLRTLAPFVGFSSGCAITMIAKQALNRAGIRSTPITGRTYFAIAWPETCCVQGHPINEIDALLP